VSTTLAKARMENLKSRLPGIKVPSSCARLTSLPLSLISNRVGTKQHIYFV
jgi:hypothetical protein